MHTKCGFPLVPVPTYLPTSKKLGQSSVCYIEDAANWEVSSVEQEMLTIMEEQQEDSPHDLSNASFHSSVSRSHSFGLNDMGYGLNRISPITFDGDAFQTPDNRTQGRALMSTPRKKDRQSGSQEDQQDPSMNRTYPQKQTSKQDDQVRSKSYNVDTSVRNAGWFIPPGQSNPSDNNPSSSEYDSNQTVFQGHTHQRLASTGTGMSQQSNTAPAPTGVTRATQTFLERNTQVLVHKLLHLHHLKTYIIRMYGDYTSMRHTPG